MEVSRHNFIELPKKALIFSVALHLFISAFFISLPYLSDMGINIFPKKKKLDYLYQSFVQVDVVGLPDQLINDKLNPLLPLTDKSPVSIEEPIKDTPKENTKDLMEDVQNKAAEKKLADKKREKIRKAEEKRAMKEALQEAKREQALKGLQGKSTKNGRKKIKGNLLSEGTSTTGAIGNLKDKYTGILVETMKQHFNIYSWQQKKNLVAEVKIMLFANGKVRYRKISKSSNDALYDSAVLQSIDDAEPFPTPEDKSLLDEEITINFKP